MSDLTDEIDKWAREQQAAPAVAVATPQGPADAMAATYPNVDPEIVKGFPRNPPTAREVDAYAGATGKLSADEVMRPVGAEPAPGPSAPVEPTRKVLTHPGAAAAQPAQAPQPMGPAAAFADPFKNQEAQLGQAHEDLMNQSVDMRLAQQNRAAAYGAVPGEQGRYASQVRAEQSAQQDEADRMHSEHAGLVRSEASRDFSAEFFKKMPAGAKVVNVLAAMAGGFLQGWNHLASNPALDQLNHQVDRYVSQQEQNSKLKIGDSNSVYDHFLEKTRSRQAASALVHASTLDALHADIERAARETQDVEERGNLMAGAHQVDLQRAKFLDEAARARGAGGMSPMQLVELHNKMLEGGKIEAETAKLRGEGGAPAVAGAAQKVIQGGEMGWADRLAAEHAGEEGLTGGAARAFLGEEGTEKNANLHDLAVADMKASGTRINPVTTEAWMRDRGYYHHPEAAARRAASKKNPLISEAEAKGSSDYEGAEEQ